VVERYVYSAYGQVTFCDASWTPLTSGGTNTTTTPGVSSAVGNNTLYASMVLDPRTGLFYDEHRWYDAWTSTFVSQDPLGCRGGINLYEYVGDSPLVHVDASGLFALHIKFGAYIPNSLGVPIAVPGAPAGINWQWEPWQPIGDHMFGTDDRAVPSVGGSNRLWSTIDVPNVNKLGNLMQTGAVTVANHPGVSHRIRATEVWTSPPPDQLDGPHLVGYAYVPGSYEFLPAKLSEDIHEVIDTSALSTSVHIAAKAGYPFVSGSPQIRYDITISLCDTSAGTVIVGVKGSHSAFPNFELIANNQVKYDYRTKYSGPGFWDLFWMQTPVNGAFTV
jgi:RHS repeat-associated protein